MIKKLLKYGTVAAASFELGTIAQTHYLNHKAKGSSPKIWEGETNTVNIGSHYVYDILEHIEDSRDNNPVHDALFVDEDIVSISRKIRHSLADVDEDNSYFEIEIEMNDRERLRAMENIPKEYVDCFRNPK